jgi:hypothetical protein
MISNGQKVFKMILYINASTNSAKKLFKNLIVSTFLTLNPVRKGLRAAVRTCSRTRDTRSGRSGTFWRKLRRKDSRRRRSGVDFMNPNFGRNVFGKYLCVEFGTKLRDERTSIWQKWETFLFLKFAIINNVPFYTLARSDLTTHNYVRWRRPSREGIWTTLFYK